MVNDNKFIIFAFMIDKKENYRGQFKFIDTEEKAYFLGFAFGDGCNSYNSKYKFTIASINTDVEVFLKFGEIFPFFKVCTYPSYPKLIYLVNSEKNLVLDFKDLGLIQNKKLHDLEKKFHIPKIDSKLLHHFVRGFFDADGAVYVPTRVRSRNNVKVDIGLGTENFCLELRKIFKEAKLNFTYTVRDKKAGNGKFYPSYILRTSAREDSLKFAEYIYKDATIFLKRKHEKFFKYVKSELQLKSEKFPKCPYCQGKSTSEGIRGKKQRLHCTSCNKNYSVSLPLTQEIV